MGNLNIDIQMLSNKIDQIVSEAKYLSIYEFIQQGLKITTIRRFTQKQKGIFAISTDILRDICVVIDRNKNTDSSYLYELNYILQRFVNDHIDIFDTQVLTKIGITRGTLKNMRKNKYGCPYNISTLVKYAKLIDDWREKYYEKSVQA